MTMPVYRPGDVATAPQGSPEPDEMVIFQIHPSFFATGRAYLGAAILSLLLSGIIGLLDLSPQILAVLTAVIFAFPAFRHLRRNRTSYILTRDKLRVESGLFSRTVRHIPLRSMQDVTLNISILERLLGIGNVVVDSAAEAGKIQMQQIHHPRKYAEMIMQQMHRWH